MGYHALFQQRFYEYNEVLCHFLWIKVILRRRFVKGNLYL